MSNIFFSLAECFETHSHIRLSYLETHGRQIIGQEIEANISLRINPKHMVTSFIISRLENLFQALRR